MKQKTALQLLIEDLEGLKNNAELLYEKLNRPEEEGLIIAYSTSIRLAKEKLSLEESQIKEAYEAGKDNYIDLMDPYSTISEETGTEYFSNTFEQ